MKVQYRNARYSDKEQMKEIVNICFSLSSYVNNEKVLDSFLDCYVDACYVEQTFMQVAVVEKKVVGVIMRGNHKHRIQLKKLPYVANLLYANLKLHIRSKKYQCDTSDYQHITGIYDSFLEKQTEAFDGVLTLFAILPGYQGYGIGSYLWDRGHDYFKSSSVKRLYLFTDSSCNYAFYDKKGFRRIDSMMMQLTNNKNRTLLDVMFYEYTM